MKLSEKGIYGIFLIFFFLMQEGGRREGGKEEKRRNSPLFCLGRGGEGKKGKGKKRRGREKGGGDKGGDTQRDLGLHVTAAAGPMSSSRAF